MTTTKPCEAPGCEKRTAVDVLACPQHWYALPKPLRDAINRSWSRRQVDESESAAHIAAKAAARRFWTGRNQEARAYTKRNAVACPCCGAAVLVALDGGPLTVAAMQAAKREGARFALVRAEDAEVEIRECDYKPVDPLGGRWV